MKFIGRSRDLAYLNDRWNSSEAEFTIVYGRRRVGKTELIKHYIESKTGLYFLADRRPGPQQLQQLGMRLGSFFKDPITARNGFSNWVDLFEYIKNHAKQRFVLAIDEYPYLTESDPAVGSLFQKGWDEYLKYTPLHLILCGSSIAMGKERFGEIANTTGISKSALTMYLKTLIALHMIEKVVPVTEKMPEKSKISRYRLSDPFFKVWFHYVFPFKSELEFG